MTDVLTKDTFKAGLTSEGQTTVPAPMAPTDAATKKYIDDLIAALPVSPVEPSGVMKQYGGDVAPSGYLLCDGSLVSRTTYAALFAIVGVKFGIGDGSTTFALPDLRGRFPIGYDSNDSTVDVIGRRAGSLVEHLHSAGSLAAPSHLHILDGSTGVAQIQMATGAMHMRRVASPAAWTATHQIAASVGGGVSSGNGAGLMGNTGSPDRVLDVTGTTGNTTLVRNPYIVLNFIIKT